MSRFERPTDAIENAADLRIGDRIWHVYGIWPPQMGGEYIVTIAAGPFKLHREYSDIHSSSAEAVIFETRWADGKVTSINFATDGNMVPRHSHNDNYWFRSEAAAAAAVEMLKAAWEASGKIAEEILRREEDRRFYDYA